MLNIRVNKPSPVQSSEQNSFFNRQVNTFFSPSVTKPVQAKRRLGEVNDKYEQEADAVADRVVQNEGGHAEHPSNPPLTHNAAIQRKCAACESEKKLQRQTEESENEIQRKAFTGGGNEIDSGEIDTVLASSGHGIDSGTRTFMESHFNRDFSQVRLHTNAQAAASAQSIQAKAYTSGNNIVFSEGQYNPGTKDGRHLLAHELTHVVQQGGAQATHNTIQGKLTSRKIPGEKGAMPTISRGVGADIQAEMFPGNGFPAPTSASPTRRVIGIELDHRENGGLGRFDALLYDDCTMKIQLRMNFNFLGPWPNVQEQRNWQARFISSVETAWSNKFDLRTNNIICPGNCRRVRPHVKIYAPHNSPHVTVDVTHTGSFMVSRAGYGVAHLDSQDLTPTNKGNLTAQERQAAGVQQQVPAVHEFGHLIGLDDVYQADNQTCAGGYPLAGIMCFGNEVQAQDYQPFANVLNTLTGCNYSPVPLGPFPEVIPPAGDFPLPEGDTRIA